MKKRFWGPAVMFPLCGLALFQTASAEQILLHTELVRPNRLHAEFKVNPKRGTAGVKMVVDHDTSGEEYNVHHTEITKKVDGLTYDTSTREIRYKDTVCGKVRDSRLLHLKRHTIEETGNCKLIKTESKLHMDNGVDDPHHRPLTELFLQVPDGQTTDTDKAAGTP